MSNYTKSTNFTAKDALPSGNSAKVVKGTEIDNEFIAISSAISSKADLNSPALTGTPTAPTATVGTNTTQVATTAFVKSEITNLNLGNMSTQNKTAIDITGGTITGVTISNITDLAVADGGTGASAFTANHVVLGNGTSSLAGNMVAPGTSGNVLTSNGTTWVSSAQPIKAWVNFNGDTTSPVTIRASLNVSSVTRSAGNVFTINFTNALADADYVPLVTAPSYGPTNLTALPQVYNSSTDPADIAKAGTKSTTQLAVCYGSASNSAFYAPKEMYVAVIR